MTLPTLEPPDDSEAAIAAFDAVCTRLSGFDRKLGTEWIDGFLTALIAGPRAVPEEEWLPAMCGDAFERTFADPDDVAQAVKALHRRRRQIATELDPEQLDRDADRLRLRPVLMMPDEEGPPAQPTGTDWAAGFDAATQAFAADWTLPAKGVGADDASYFGACLRQVAALTLQDEALQQHLRSTYAGQTLTRDDLVDEACFAVQELRLFWLDHAPKPEPRRVEATPGRNDPCPCGSGKKYKKCHGASAPSD
jgi:uncharacterized protein